MATKTIVCPECQAPVVSGRFACAQCGALLASVALTPRSNGRADHSIEPDVAATVAPPDLPTRRRDASATRRDDESTVVARTAARSRRTPVAPAWTHSLAAEPEESAPGADERWDDQPLTVGHTTAVAEPAVPPAVAMAANPVAPATVSDVLARSALAPAVERKAAPIAAVKAAAVSKVRRRAAPDPEALARIAPLAEPLPVAETDAVAEVARAPAPPTFVQPERARIEPAVHARVARAEPAARVEPAGPAQAAPRPEPFVRPDVVPAWPPPGDRGPLAEPVARTPAGLYLPPSAVLPPGEALPLPVAAKAEARAPSDVPSAGATSERPSAADRLAQLDLPADTPRRVVAIGAVIVVLGFLLPWTASPTGNDVLGDYLLRWGLAGAGAWIIVALLIGLAGLTLAGGRLATVPVGLPGVAVAMLVLGLAWPYLFGFGGRAVGIWVVVAGLLLLAVGGLLDMRASRHGNEPPIV